MKAFLRLLVLIVLLLSSLKTEAAGFDREATESHRFETDLKIINKFNGKVSDSRKFFGEGQTDLNPALSSFDFFRDLRSGDIIISKGMRFYSSLISRAAKEPTRYSHLVLVYRDAQTEELSFMEAEGVQGAHILSAREYLSHPDARAAIFRFQDSKLAAQAAQKMKDLISERLKREGYFPYGFELDPKDESRLFCSEVARRAYARVGVEIPEHPSEANLPNLWFKKALKLKVASGFRPSDLESDSRFELLAEWRNPALLSESLLRDKIVDQILDDLRKNPHQQLKLGLLDRAKASLWHWRNNPEIGPWIRKKIPPHISLSTLKVILAIESIGNRELKKKGAGPCALTLVGLR